MRRTLLAGFIVIAASACSTPTTATALDGTENAGCADVTRVQVTQTGSDTYDFAVTISSPDEGWDKYADAFEVRSSTGEVLGTRVLTHPHVEEQPFTRSLTSVTVDSEPWVEIAASDLVEGFCGLTQVVTLDQDSAP